MEGVTKQKLPNEHSGEAIPNEGATGYSDRQPITFVSRQFSSSQENCV